MYDGIRAGGAGAAFYFIVMVILGDFIILNLFLAILLTNFDGLGEAQEEEKEAHEHMDLMGDEEGEGGGGGGTKCCGLCGKKKIHRTRVVPAAEPVTAATSDEAWNFARRDEVDYDEKLAALDGVSSSSADGSERKEKDGRRRNGDNDLDDDFANLSDDEEDRYGADGAPSSLSVSPNRATTSTDAKVDPETTLQDMKMAMGFTQRLQKNRRGSLASPSVARSMSMHTNDLIADIYIMMQDGTLKG